MNKLSKPHLIAPLLASFASLLSATAAMGQDKPEFDISSVASIKGTSTYEASIESLRANYTFPQWFRDGKFGIFIHWGVYSVPAFGSEWYPRNMYRQDSKDFRHHRETWGDHTKFGYKDFIPMFTAEKFDPDKWVELFKRAGARYVMPVAEHHDGFAMYDSRINPWNAVRMGPKKDIVALLREATLKQDLIFCLSTHRGENYYFFNGGMEFPSDVQDMSLSLYGTRSPEGRTRAPDEKFMHEWITHLYEIVNYYQPSMIFFDGTPGDRFFREHFTRFMAHYYNSALDWGTEVGVNYKLGYPSDVAIFDVERGKLRGIRRHPWQSDSSVGKQSWSHITGEEYKSAGQLVRDMADIVSKNGSFLVNIGPRADGSIPDEVKRILLDIGGWLGVNGEAIYGTRPWVKYGEGDTVTAVGAHSDGNETPYTAQDIRFTTKDGALYAITLAWTDGDIVIKSLDQHHGKDLRVKSVSMVGSNATIAWEHTAAGLKITFPKEKPSDFAHAFKIELEGLAYGAPQPYFVERDSSPPKTADAYVYNHGPAPATVKARVLARGAEVEKASFTVNPGAAHRIETRIEAIPEVLTDPSILALDIE